MLLRIDNSVSEEVLFLQGTLVVKGIVVELEAELVHVIIPRRFVERAKLVRIRMVSYKGMSFSHHLVQEHEQLLSVGSVF